jgi:hypothetical protein
MIAWLVIFIHGIIPHNHLNEKHNGCHKIIHNIVLHDHERDHDHTSRYADHPAEEKICHFSSFLYNHFSQDSFFLSTNIETHYPPVNLSESFKISYKDYYFSRPYYGSSSLRAPPQGLKQS